MSERVDVKKTYKLFINGAFVRSESGRSYEVFDHDGVFLANIAQASRKDADLWARLVGSDQDTGTNSRRTTGNSRPRIGFVWTTVNIESGTYRHVVIALTIPFPLLDSCAVLSRECL